MARLGHHIEEARALLRQNTEAGKKMDFIAQECNGKPTPSVPSAGQRSVGGGDRVKEQSEKIREQANNVE